MPPQGHNQDLQSSPEKNSVNKNNSLVKLNNVENIHMNCKDHENSVKLDNDNSVQWIDDVFDFGISSSCILANHAGTCVRYYSQNIEDHSVAYFSHCVCPTVVVTPTVGQRANSKISAANCGFIILIHMVIHGIVLFSCLIHLMYW